jgi:ATP-dependent phosphofructokinase / diphosphate-dependent phosphofructokinase
LSPNLIVGQSGGPTAVINASLVGVIEEARRKPGIDRILGMRRGVEGLLDGDLVDLTELPQATLETLAATPGAALGACRRKITDDEAVALLEALDRHRVQYLCYIGGNDSADTTQRLARAAVGAGHELRAISVPKTIDNDLPETDHCPGYGSVARYVAIAASESTLDTRSLPTYYPVKIIEVMGRDAGWLAAAAGLARANEEDGPHLIYVPEVPFDSSSFLSAVEKVHARLGYAVVVVAETVRDTEGKPVASDVAFVDEFGHPIVRGTAETLVRLVFDQLGLHARADKPGSLQRSSQLAQSPVDLAEAREAGREAVRLAVEGHSGRMVAIDRISNEPYQTRMSSVDLDCVANRQRLLPRGYLDEEGTFITDAFREYALPLLGPDPFPDFVRL